MQRRAALHIGELRWLKRQPTCSRLRGSPSIKVILAEHSRIWRMPAPVQALNSGLFHTSEAAPAT
jgi:hypothetical protein